MKQIDLEPTGYRREDPATGEMKPPVNRQLMRVLFYAGLATLIMFGFQAISAGLPVHWVVAPALIGGGCGAACILSLRRPDW